MHQFYVGNTHKNANIILITTKHNLLFEVMRKN